MKRTKLLLTLLFVSVTNASSFASSSSSERTPLLGSGTTSYSSSENVISLVESYGRAEWKRMSPEEIKGLATKCKIEDPRHDFRSSFDEAFSASGCCSSSIKYPENAKKFLRIYDSLNQSDLVSYVTRNATQVLEKHVRFTRRDIEPDDSSDEDSTSKDVKPSRNPTPTTEFQRIMSPAPMPVGVDSSRLEALEGLVKSLSQQSQHQAEQIAALQKENKELRGEVHSLSQGVEELRESQSNLQREYAKLNDLITLIQRSQVSGTDGGSPDPNYTDIAQRLVRLELAIRLEQASGSWETNGIALKVDTLAKTFRALNKLADAHYREEYAGLLNETEKKG